jgi:hypothetical protein
MIWFSIEVMAFDGIIISNVSFMLLRSIFGTKVDPGEKIQEARKLVKIDTILALRPMCTTYHTAFISFYVTVIIISSKYYDNGSKKEEMIVMAITSLISLACFTCQIFVTWKTGPIWWQKNGLRLF